MEDTNMDDATASEPTVETTQATDNGIEGPSGPKQLRVMGRTMSFRHSLRTTEKPKKPILESTKVLYKYNEFLAVYADESDDKFWLCRCLDDVLTTQDTWRANWLEKTDAQNWIFQEVEFEDDITKDSVICKVTLKDASTATTDGLWKLLPTMQEKIKTELKKQLETGEGPSDKETSDDEITRRTKGRPNKRAKKHSDDDEEPKPKRVRSTRASTKASSSSSSATTSTPAKRTRPSTSSSASKQAKPKKTTARTARDLKPNTDVQEYEQDWFCSRPAGQKLPEKCSALFASRELTRMAASNDIETFLAELSNPKVAHPRFGRSVSLGRQRPLFFLLKHNNIPAIRTYLTAVQKDDVKREAVPQSSLATQDTGSYSKYTFGRKIAAIHATRGGREGNNAFAKDQEYFDNDITTVSEEFMWALRCNIVSVEAIDVYFEIFPPSFNDLSCVYSCARSGNHVVLRRLVYLFRKFCGGNFNNLHEEVLDDEKKPAKILSVSVTKKGGMDAITPLHFASINPNENQLKALIEVNPNIQFADDKQAKPVHFAAACAGTGPLNVLLSRGSSPMDTDRSAHNPLFYAVLANRTHNVQLLINHVSMQAANNQSSGFAFSTTATTPAKGKGKKRRAASNDDDDDDGDDDGDADDNGDGDGDADADGDGDADATPKAPVDPEVEKKNKEASAAAAVASYLNSADHHGNTALHHACIVGNLDIVKLLVKHGASASRQNKAKECCLVIASKYGHLDVVRFLVEEAGCHAARSVDKLRRSPLIHASLNGHLNLVTYLLRTGVDPNFPDSSGNTPLHYAAAYGWEAVVDALVDGGATVGTFNMWNTLPLSLSQQKGHNLITKQLLQYTKPEDMNARDEHGRTILLGMCIGMHANTLKDMKEIVEEKNADVTVTDMEGFSGIHHVAVYSLKLNPSSRNVDELSKVAVDTAEYLLQKGLDVNVKNHANLSALFVGLSVFASTGSQGQINLNNSNTIVQFTYQTWPRFDVVRFLLSKGADVSGKDPENGRNFLHFLALVITGFEQNVLANLATQQQQTIDSKLAQHKQAVSDFKEVLEALNPEELQALSKDTDNVGLTPVLLWLYNCNAHSAQQPAQRQVVEDFSSLFQLFVSKCGGVGGTVQKLSAPVSFLDGEIEFGADGGKTALHLCVERGLVKELEHVLTTLKESSSATDMDTGSAVGLNTISWEPTFSTKQTNWFKSGQAHNNIYWKPPPRDGVDVSVFEYSGVFGRTALHLAVLAGNETLTRILLEAGSNPNIPMNTRRSHEVFKTYCVHSAAANISMLTLLLKHKADPNARQQDQKCPLHMVASNRLLSCVSLLLSLGAEPNAEDEKKRTPLHFATNATSCGADASFDVENLLISKGANANALDHYGRTPLHYCFLKMGKDAYSNVSAADPIEAVSSLTAIEKISLQVQDQWGNTPLHYAALHAANISSLFLLKLGVAIDVTNTYGNTPLCVAVASGHRDYAANLIHQGASVTHPITLLAAKGAIVERKRSLFWKAVDNNWQGVAYLMLQFKFPIFTALEDCIDNGRFVMCLNLLNKLGAEERTKVAKQANDNGHTLLHAVASTPVDLSFPTPDKESELEYIKVMQFLLDHGANHNALDSSNSTPLHLAAHNRHAGVIRKLLSVGTQLLNAPDLNGKTALMLAVEGHHPSLESRRSAHNTTVTAKGASAKPPKLQKSHSAAMIGDDNGGDSGSGSGNDSDDSSDDDNDDADNDNDDNDDNDDDDDANDDGSGDDDDDGDDNDDSGTPVRMTIGETGKSSSVNSVGNQIDDENASRDNDMRSMILMLKAGASTSGKYTDPAHPEGQTTILAHLVQTFNHQMLRVLLKYTVNLNEPDGKGLTPLMHAVRTNHTQLVDVLLQSQGLNINATDDDGRNVVHHVVSPLTLGSYENTQLLEKLVAHNAQINNKDKAKHTPMYYASLQKSGVMVACLEKLGASTTDKVQEVPPTPQLTSSFGDAVDFQADANALLAEARKKNDQVEGIEPIVDQVAKQNSSHQPLLAKVHVVMCDDEGNEINYKNTKKSSNNNSSSNNAATTSNNNNSSSSNSSSNGVLDANSAAMNAHDVFDCVMTKVDVKKMEWGMNLFYRMQILKNPALGLYILWTRWGRIGDTGQYQQTPFKSCNEAVVEFKKIFRSKTGNNWADRKTFQRKSDKYQVHAIDYVKKKSPESDLLKSFDFSESPPSVLPKEMQTMMRCFVDVSTLNQAAKAEEIDTDVMPLVKMTPDYLMKVEEVLTKISDELALIKNAPTKLTLDEQLVAMEKIATLSNLYYEMLPSTRFQADKIPPLTNYQLWNREWKRLSTLINLEQASKIILGAHFRKLEIHPLDYCFRALGLAAELLPKNSPEYTLVENATKGTGGSSLDGREVFGVVKVERKGERERLSRTIENHRLLWHGSKLENFLGILSEGFRVAPPEASMTGHAFGMGIYFADEYIKSHGYCSTTTIDKENKDVAVMTLCRVCVGKPMEVIHNNMMANSNSDKVPIYSLCKAPDGFDSVQAIGKLQPDSDLNVVLPNGVTVAVGEEVSMEWTESDKKKWEIHYDPRVQRNEFIVFKEDQVMMSYLVLTRRVRE